jgi:PAS domain S-box-containing protein
MNFPADQMAADLPLEQLRIFRRAATLLASSLEFEPTLANTISACLPALGDFGFFDIVAEGGVRRTARAHLDPETESILLPTRWIRQERTDMNLCALSTNRAALHNDIDDGWYRKVAVNDGHLAMLRKLAFRSMLTVPMRYGEELIGALTLFMRRSGRNHSQADLDFAMEIAALAAPVVVNVSLLAKQRRAEAALRVSEERFRLATDAGNIGIWDWNIATNSINWSDSLYQLHGVAPGRFGGRIEDFSELVHPDDRAALMQKIDLAIRDTDVFAAEYRIVLPDGMERWLSTQGHLYRGANRVATRMVGAVIDITDRQRIETRLRLLDSISQATRAATAPKAIMETITRLVGEHLGVTRCAYADLEADNDHFTIRDDWTTEGTLSTVGEYSLDLFGSRAAAELRIGRTLVIRDVDSELAPADGADMFNAIGIKAIITCPLVKEGRLLALMAVHQSAPRNWTADDVALLEEVVERSWAHIERVRATQALHESEAHLSSIFEQTAVGIAESDLSGRITSINDRYCQILGRSREAIIGQRIHDLTHPDDLADNLRLFENLLKSGTPFEMEKRYLRPDRPPVWCSTTVTLIRPAGDKPTEVVLAVVVDITERKHAEEKHRETARRLQFTLEAAEIGDWDLDLIDDKAYRSLRHDQCFGYMEPITDWGFEVFIEHVHPDDREFVAQQFRTALAELKDWHFECRVVWPDQSIHWIAAHGSIYQVDTRPTRMSGIVFDITERKQVEEALHTADRRKDEFLAMLAHELRNPLAPISAAADLLRLARLDATHVRQTSEIISRQVRNMTDLVDDLLDVSRVTRGLVALDNLALDAKRIVSDAIEQVQPLIEARRHHLAVHMPPESALVWGDKKRVVQVLVNLLNNAAKYTPEGGNIIFSTEVRDEHVVFTVADNGTGMAPDMVERAFELFAQAERSSDRSQGGLGLGLALVKSLVELHEGYVSAYSEGLGKGSRFTVLLPRLKEENAASGNPQHAAAINTPAKNLKVLVVDDNVDAAQMLAMFLETLGHRVFVEHESGMALERAKLESPDICLLDIGLPDMDGHELARRLRAQPQTANAVLTAITGYGQEQDRRNILDAGFDHHFVKPVDTARLADLLNSLDAD